MRPRDFEFDLQVDAGQAPALLADSVSAEVIRHLGYDTDAAARFAGEINVAVAEICRAGEPCRVHFRASGGNLEVLVSSGAHGSRRFVRPIP